VIEFMKKIINVMWFNFGINFIHVIKIHPFEHPYNYVYVVNFIYPQVLFTWPLTYVVNFLHL
jgi:hypothetical protein